MSSLSFTWLYPFHYATSQYPLQAKIPQKSYKVIGIRSPRAFSQTKTNDELSLYYINVIPVTWYGFNYNSVIFSSYEWKPFSSTHFSSQLCYCKLFCVCFYHAVDYKTSYSIVTSSIFLTAFSFFFLFLILFFLALSFSLVSVARYLSPFSSSSPKHLVCLVLSRIIHSIQKTLPHSIVNTNSLHTLRRK